MAKVSMPFSLDDSHIQFIREHGGSDNMSLNLRASLDAAIADTSDLVRYDPDSILAGDYTPEFQNPDAFLLYTKTESSVEYGKNLPFPISRKTPADIVAIADEAGFRTQAVNYQEHGFIALWAAPTKDSQSSKCSSCKEKLQSAFCKLLEEQCC
jgi:hypothetical protein